MATPNSYPYTPVPANLKQLFERIPTIGIPEKASQNWLAGLGFTGGNNMRNLAVMRQVGIIESDGTPGELYKALRSKDKVKFAAGVRKCYADLFSTYPDAHRKDNEALIAFIRSKTDYAEQAQRFAVRTFKVLTEFGDFDQPSVTLPAERPTEKGEEVKEHVRSRREEPVAPEMGRIALTVNIQLQLPPSAEGDVYEKLFAAMAKHLKGLVSVE
jgi:hypothetical protein